MAETARGWDAAAYHAVSGPMVALGAEVVRRLALHGDEVVLDAGCGTGRVTALLLERLPRGRVLAVDADPGMLERARELLGGDPRVSFTRADLVDLVLDEPVDAVLSTATFHWVGDHERLFAALHAALRRGGQLAAQWGGRGNIAACLSAADQVAARPRWAAAYEGWVRPTRFDSAEETAQRLRRAGFTDVRCRLTPRPQVPEDARAYLSTVTIAAHLDRLDAPDRDGFLDEVLALLPEPITVDYVRLDADAVRG